jgi:6-phosphogluconolactonase
MQKTIVSSNAEHAARSAARLLVTLLDDRRDEAGAAHIALAGGDTPRQAYAVMATLVDDWTGIHIWFGDERMVPLDDPSANARMVAESLLVDTPLPADHVHVVRTPLGAATACDAYAHELRRHLPANAAGLPVLDIAFLGLGEDAHTASLFPDAPTLSCTGVCAVVDDAPKPPPVRITLTMPVLAAARHRVVLATGAGKADAVAAALGTPDPSYPASLLPRDGTTWILDAAAAAHLSEGERP